MIVTRIMLNIVVMIKLTIVMASNGSNNYIIQINRRIHNKNHFQGRTAFIIHHHSCIKSKLIPFQLLQKSQQQQLHQGRQRRRSRNLIFNDGTIDNNSIIIMMGRRNKGGRRRNSNDNDDDDNESNMRNNKRVNRKNNDKRRNKESPITLPLLSSNPTTRRVIVSLEDEDKVEESIYISPSTSQSLVPLQQQQRRRRLPNIVIYEIEDDEWWNRSAEIASSSSKSSSSSSSSNSKESIGSISRDVSRNPYGCRAWPPSLAIAKHFVKLLLLNSDDDDNILQGRTILELGCGCGLTSIAIASAIVASSSSDDDDDNNNGDCLILPSTILATDVSPDALKLGRKGWKDTLDKMRIDDAKKKRRIMKKRNNNSYNDDNSIDDDGNIDHRKENIQTPTTKRSRTTTFLSKDSGGREENLLTFATFDLTSPLPLPLSLPISSSSSSPSSSSLLPPVIIATAIMYEADLARALARRVHEAVVLHDAFVILGDGDEGEREGARNEFVEELDRLILSSSSSSSIIVGATAKRREGVEKEVEGMIGGSNRTDWMPLQSVRCRALGWMEKSVRVMYVNPPPGLLFETATTTAVVTDRNLT